MPISIALIIKFIIEPIAEILEMPRHFTKAVVAEALIKEFCNNHA